jgi:hypothetical protein
MGKPLYIPPSKGETGLKVFCKKCRKEVYSVCKETMKPIETCVSSDSHVFKVSVHLPGTKYQKKSKFLKTRILSEAKKEAIDFNNLIKERFDKNATIPEYPILTPIIPTVESLNKPQYLEEAIFKYLAFLNNEGVPVFKRKNRGARHLVDLKNELLFLLKVLKDSGFDPATVRISSFYSDEIISVVYDSLISRYSQRTVKKRFTLYKAFELYLHKE